MANSNTNIVVTLGNIVAGYKIIGEASKLKLEVIGNPSNSKWTNPRLKNGSRGESYAHSFFINLKAVESRKVRSVINAFYEYNGLEFGSLSREDEMKLEMPLSDFKFNLTKEVIVHVDQDAPRLPMKGDVIECSIGYAMDTAQEDGYARDQNNQKILEVKNFVVPEAKEDTGFSWDSFTKNDDTEERQSVVADDTAVEDSERF